MAEVPLNVKLQQQNLIHVCRLIIKSLLDKACRESVIEEGCRELHNLLAVIEHILMFRIKPHLSWYGAAESRWFWDYIKIACKDFPNNCINSIESLANAKTARGKGRGWLRLALMEKKLADYLTYAIQQKDLTKSIYLPGAIVLGEEAAIFVGNLVGLNAVDFSFDVKSATLDRDSHYVIDQTPYLTFNHNEINQESFFKDITDTRTTSEDQIQVLRDQKGYFEELVKLREEQLLDSNQEKAELLESLHRCQEDSRKQKQQLESIIIELQTQLSVSRHQHSRQIRSLQQAFDASNDPNSKSLPMIEITAPTPTVPDAPEAFPRCSVGVQTEMKFILMSETKSIASTTSLGKDENPSLMPLTGSLSSGTSVFVDGPDTETMSGQGHKEESMSSQGQSQKEESMSTEGQDHKEVSMSPVMVRTEPSNKRSMTDVSGEKSPPSKITLLSEDVIESVDEGSSQSDPSSDFQMISSGSSTMSNNEKTGENCPDSVTGREQSPDYEMISTPSTDSDYNEAGETGKDEACEAETAKSGTRLTEKVKDYTETVKEDTLTEMIKEDTGLTEMVKEDTQLTESVKEDTCLPDTKHEDMKAALEGDDKDSD